MPKKAAHPSHFFSGFDYTKWPGAGSVKRYTGMAVKHVKWTFLGFISFLVLYLGTVWLWASASAPELLVKVAPGGPAAGLDPQLVASLIKIEDPSFYSHSGLDISNGQGLTTITSVVARMVFLGDQQLNGIKGTLQSFYRRVFSCCKRLDFGRDVMALVLNSHVAKRDQLNIFMSNAYLGSHNGRAVIGFEDAALSYYGKNLSELSENDFYGIVAMLLAPNYYHPVKNPQVHARRVERLQAVASGKCAPNGWLDLTYEHCAIDA